MVDGGGSRRNQQKECHQQDNEYALPQAAKLIRRGVVGRSSRHKLAPLSRGAGSSNGLARSWRNVTINNITRRA